jgi:uncharacterized membrane protein YeaQ/YmgE (transglycosylase-associated protein family)
VSGALLHGAAWRGRGSFISILAWLVFGLASGFIGRKVIASDGLGLQDALTLGVSGALLGGLLFSLFDATGITAANPWGIVLAVVGSAALLGASQLFWRRN